MSREQGSALGLGADWVLGATQVVGSGNGLLRWRGWLGLVCGLVLRIPYHMVMQARWAPLYGCV